MLLRARRVRPDKGDASVRIHKHGSVFAARKRHCKPVLAVRKDRGIIVARHLHKEIEVRIAGIGVERLERDNDDDERDDHRKTCPEHAVPVFLVQLHHLLIVHRLVVGVLFLQFIEIIAHIAHDERLLARLDALIDVKGEGDRLQNERKTDDADADDADTFNDRSDALPEPVQPDLIPLLKQEDRHAV